VRLDGGCSWLGARPVNREGVIGCRGLQGGDRGRADLACCGCCLQRPAGEVGLPCPAAMGSGLLRQQERRKHGGVLVDLLPRRWAAIRGCGLGCRVWRRPGGARGDAALAGEEGGGCRLREKLG